MTKLLFIILAAYNAFAFNDAADVLTEKCYESAKWYFLKKKGQSEMFLDKETCEKQRESEKHYFSSRCEYKFDGEDVVMTLFKTSYVHDDSAGKDSFTVYFQSKEKCENAIQNGLKNTYLEVFQRKTSISPANSKDKLRFEGFCTEEAITVCSKAGIKHPGFQIF